MSWLYRAWANSQENIGLRLRTSGPGLITAGFHNYCPCMSTGRSKINRLSSNQKTLLDLISSQRSQAAAQLLSPALNPHKLCFRSLGGTIDRDKSSRSVRSAPKARFSLSSCNSKITNDEPNRSTRTSVPIRQAATGN